MLQAGGRVFPFCVCDMKKKNALKDRECCVSLLAASSFLFGGHQTNKQKLSQGQGKTDR